MKNKSQYTKNRLSIVVPVYRGRIFLRSLTERIIKATNEIQFEPELILVDDGCPENSWEEILQLCNQHNCIQGIRLSRNFGQHNAITAGLHHTSGEWTVIMDCDLQDRPEEIPRLYQATKGKYHLVRAKRTVRQDKRIKKLSSVFFNYIFSYLTGTQKNPAIANFGIYHHNVVQATLSMEDRIRFTPSLMEWVGFNEYQIDVEHGARTAGKSSYSWYKLFGLALDNIVAFSLKPLHLTLRLGFLIAFIAFIMAVYYLWKKANGTLEVPGYASIIISIWFLSGIIVSVLGVVGLYVGYTFNNTKSRPHYVIHEHIHSKEA